MSARKSGSGRKRPVSEKKIVKIEETEDLSITQLKVVNEDLQKENSSLKESVNHYHNKLQTIIQHVLDLNGITRERDLNNGRYELVSGLAVVDIPDSEVTRMISDLTIPPSDILNNYEVRLEDLETRLTQLSTELAKLLKLKLTVEKGLQEMQRIYSLEDIKVTAKMMWYNSCITHVYAVPVETSENVDGFNQSSLSEMSCRPTSVAAGQGKVADIQELIPAHYLSSRAQSIILTPANLDMAELEPPDKKMPGETHIFQMHVGLRSLIIRELSKHKGNANDWRLMASRVGIPDGLVEQWTKMRAPNAMALVMKVWGDSVGATVRMLHRHLVSPQMKAIVLAKRISDFYDVD